MSTVSPPGGLLQAQLAVLRGDAVLQAQQARGAVEVRAADPFVAHLDVQALRLRSRG